MKCVDQNQYSKPPHRIHSICIWNVPIKLRIQIEKDLMPTRSLSNVYCELFRHGNRSIIQSTEICHFVAHILWYLKQPTTRCKHMCSSSNAAAFQLNVKIATNSTCHWAIVFWILNINNWKQIAFYGVERKKGNQTEKSARTLRQPESIVRAVLSNGTFNEFVEM